MVNYGELREVELVDKFEVEENDDEIIFLRVPRNIDAEEFQRRLSEFFSEIFRNLHE